MKRVMLDVICGLGLFAVVPLGFLLPAFLMTVGLEGDIFSTNDIRMRLFWAIYDVNENLPMVAVIVWIVILIFGYIRIVSRIRNRKDKDKQKHN